MEQKRVAVLGAGNGGQAMAGHLSVLGCRTALYNRDEANLAPIRERGGIELKGALQGFGELAAVTTDMATALFGAELVMVVVPAFAHRFMAETAAPFLTDDQIVILHPGRTGGALEFRNTLRAAGAKGRPVVSEAQTLLYACRAEAGAKVSVKSVKRVVELAALPAADNARVFSALQSVLPAFVPAENVLATGLANIGAVFHPTAFLLNAGAVESGEEFKFYTEGMTPAIVDLIGAIDAERMAVAAAYGVKTLSARDWLRRSYQVEGHTLHELIRRNQAYRGISAPQTLHHRYVFEDIPTGLVPFVSLGEAAGLKLPAARAVIDLAGALYRQDFWAEGRTVDRLGLGGLTPAAIRRLVNEGGKQEWD